MVEIANNHMKVVMWKRFRKQQIATIKNGTPPHTTTNNHLIELRDVVKAYHTPVGDFIALDGVSIGRIKDLGEGINTTSILS